MVWTRLSTGDPSIEVETGGQVHWNAATHAMLGNPPAVLMFHDAIAERIGFRGVYWLAPLRVLYDEDMRYTIDAGGEFEDAGLSFAEDWQATPQAPDPADPPAPGGTDQRGIVWIALP